MKSLPPSTSTELMERSLQLAGKTLGEVAMLWQEKVPSSLLRDKGWIGQLMEKVLGASACNLDQPDFIDLGIELKTLPISPQGRPCESTYICTAPIPNPDPCWEKSRVWRKMAKILWIPVESDPSKHLDEQRIGSPLLWSPSPSIAQQLRQDWEELVELMTLGHFEELSAHKGKFLQIRPKAANAKTFVKVINHEGQMISTVPKGFYLRPSFTQMILTSHYSLC